MEAYGSRFEALPEGGCGTVLDAPLRFLSRTRGDALRADRAAEPDDDYGIAHDRHPVRQRLAREAMAMAEWDAWLGHPDDTPEEVWRRWNRWQNEQRRKGGHDDA